MISNEHFNQLISRAMDELPQEYITNMENVVILYADEPDEFQRKKTHLDDDHHAMLLGLYEGIPLTQRTMGYMNIPDRITLFKHPIVRVAGENEHALFEQIKRTLWHEIAHFYGLDHPQIHALQG